MTPSYAIEISTSELLSDVITTQKFYDEPRWITEMLRFANPWHMKRRWQVELGFKLLSVARGESLSWTKEGA
jgi:hypothetical protein